MGKRRAEPILSAGDGGDDAVSIVFVPTKYEGEGREGRADGDVCGIRPEV